MIKIESVVFIIFILFSLLKAEKVSACEIESKNIWQPPEYIKIKKLNCNEDIYKLEEELILNGFAIVYPSHDEIRQVKLLTLEKIARNRNLGIWSEDKYKIKSAKDNLQQYMESFQIVKGKILKATLKKGNLYLNFGNNWRNDFTIRIEQKYIKNFQNKGFYPRKWQDREVIVRGWLEKYNGAMITVTSPVQIQLLN